MYWRQVVARTPSTLDARSGWGQDARRIDRGFRGDEAIARFAGGGASFSGRESNRVFLRTGDRFTPAHHVSGLDSRLDGRTVVAADLDRDGDLDLVLRSRGPKPLRVLRNTTRDQGSVAGAAGWLSVALNPPAGVAPDAIGATVTVEACGRTQRRVVQAGQGYLAQAPAEVHVGLGGCTERPRVGIRWPGASAVASASVSANARLVGRGRPGGRVALGAAKALPAPGGSDALGSALSVITTRSTAGQPLPLSPDGVTLVVLWAPWCSACTREIPRAMAAGVPVRFVSLELEDPDGVQAAAERYGFASSDRPALVASAALLAALMPEGRARTPVTVALDPDGRPRWRHQGAGAPFEPVGEVDGR